MESPASYASFNSRMPSENGEVLDGRASYTPLIDVNDRDNDGLTLLHHTAKARNVEYLRFLIVDKGGNLAAETKNGVTVIEEIFNNIPEPMTFFIDIFNASVRRENETGAVKLDFRILTPVGGPQMAVTYALIQAASFTKEKMLVLHPLVHAFILLKWSKMYWHLRWLAMWYMVFVVFLLWYVVILLQLIPEFPVIRWILMLYSILLLCRIFLQLSTRPSYYLVQKEALMYAICLILTIVVTTTGTLVPHDPRQNTRPDTWVLLFIGIAILLAWIELMLLIGRISDCGFYIHMYYIVLGQACRIFLAFFYLIVGFALSFSVVFYDNKQFNLLVANVKTVSMMMAEYDYDDLFKWTDENGDAFVRVMSRFLFLAFVMLVSIVLVNLMIGVVVSDIPQVRKKAHFRRLVQRGEFLGHTEFVEEKLRYQNCIADFCLTMLILKKKDTIDTEITLEPTSGFERRPWGVFKKLVECWRLTKEDKKRPRCIHRSLKNTLFKLATGNPYYARNSRMDFSQQNANNSLLDMESIL